MVNTILYFSGTRIFPLNLHKNTLCFFLFSCKDLCKCLKRICSNMFFDGDMSQAKDSDLRETHGD